MAKNKNLLIGVLAAAAVGGAIYYLLTTDRGKEILSDLKKAAGDASDKASDVFSNVSDKVSSTLSKGKDLAGQGQKAVNSMNN